MIFITASLLAIVGLGSLWLIYELAPAGRGRMPWLWLSTAIGTAGLLLAIAGLTDLRRDYLIVSSLVAAAALPLSLMLGQSEGEFLPSMWISGGVLVANGLLFLSDAIDTSRLTLISAMLGVALTLLGSVLMWQRMAGHQVLLGAGFPLLILAGLLGVSAIRTPLEYLNDVEIPKLNRAIENSRRMVNSYDIAASQATAYRDEIADLSDDNPAYVGLVDGNLGAARTHYDRAVALLAELGEPREPVAEWSEFTREEVLAATDTARRVSQEATLFTEELKRVETFYTNVAGEYVREYIWFEIGDYWPNESSYDNHPACYYGEVVSRVSPDGNVSERLVDDSRGGAFSDQQGKHWKIFTVSDYTELVNAGIIAPMENRAVNDTTVGNYLCGNDPQNGQFGVLGEPPVVLVKEQGTLQLSREDEDAFVGNYRYGAWCVADANGQYQEIPEGDPVPQEAEWCWHQPEDESTGYHYYRYWGGGGWLYQRGPRRCFDCEPQQWSSGSGGGGAVLVPASRMAEVNRTDVPGVRGPGDLGGGPGTGK